MTLTLFSIVAQHRYSLVYNLNCRAFFFYFIKSLSTCIFDLFQRKCLITVRTQGCECNALSVVLKGSTCTSYVVKRICKGGAPLYDMVHINTNLVCSFSLKQF